MKDDTAYLKLMLDSLKKIDSFIGGMDERAFAEDAKTQSAVIMQLQVLGELAKRVPEETRNNIAIPWKEMAGLRDLVAHQYFSLDIPTIWHTVFVRAPEARSLLERYLSGKEK